MNALEMPGSSLLPLFALICATLNVVLWVLRPVRRGPGPASVALSDPYEIAMLRAGPTEVIGVAALSLVERGRVECTKHHLRGLPAKDPGAGSLLQRDSAHDQIERAIITRLDKPTRAKWLFSSELLSLCEPLRTRLEALELLPSRGSLRRRKALASIGIGLIVAAGVLVGMQSKSRDLDDGWLVVPIGAGASWCAWWLAAPRRTARGHRHMKKLQAELHAGTGAGTLDAAHPPAVYRAAVLGLAALATSRHPPVAELLPYATGKWDGAGSGFPTLRDYLEELDDSQRVS